MATPTEPRTAKATAARLANMAKRRNDRAAQQLLKDSYALTDDHRTYLAALAASAPPISDERLAYLGRLLPPVTMARADVRAGVPGPS